MTKVYVLREDIYESEVLIQTNEIIGIYSSLKKAQNAMKADIEKNSTIESLFTEISEKTISVYEGSLKGMAGGKTLELRYSILPFGI